ncbi:hypothetical protein TI39_contig354g00010 [Zymoseptoria brevis]|uniref:Uncharacterized protein n=1 Tax=Zymoseptoria brevis TaxID=1047168 RepID=A0A0F4GTN8_9PEZI|nr:hypothetical protein TI39_contig354g00010 [Zymoseptoria brevis]
MDNFTADMGNAITREAIKSAVISEIKSNSPIARSSDFWYNVSQELEKDHNIARNGANIEKVCRALRANDDTLPDPREYIIEVLQDHEAAALAARQALDAQRETLQYDSIETANDPTVRIARQPLALLEQQETEQKAAKEAKEKDDSSSNNLAYRR